MRLTNLLKSVAIVVGGLAALFAFSGCTSMDPDETSVPWTRPAPYEDQAPGFGGPGF